MIEFDFGHVGLTLVCFGLLFSNYLDRKHMKSVEESLIKGVLATDPLQYKESLVTPEQRIAEAKAETILAEKAYNLHKQAEAEEGKQTTPGQRHFPVG